MADDPHKTGEVQPQTSAAPPARGAAPLDDLDLAIEAMGRLPRASAVRAAAQRLILGLRPVTHQAFINALRPQSGARWRERIVAAWGLGSGAETPVEKDAAAQVLMDALQDNGSRPVAPHLVRVALRTLVPAVLLTCYCVSIQPWQYRFTDVWFTSGLLGWAMLLPFVAPLSLIYDRSLHDRGRAAVARSMAKLGVVECIGPLAETCVRSRGPLRAAAREALDSLLPRVEAEHYGVFGASAIAALCRTLRSNDTLLVTQVLAALGHVGTSAALPELERLARDGRTMRIRDEAARVIQIVQVRQQAEKDRELLLRPASTPADHLLRPAASAGAADPALLLRAAASENGTSDGAVSLESLE